MEATQVAVASPDESIDMDTCPICFEQRGDVEAIPHVDPQGDVSGHRLCGECRQRCPECPFCRDVLTKDELVQFIQDFVNLVDANASAEGFTIHDRNDLRDERAEILQRWEVFELQHEGSPRVVRSVAKLLLEDPSFSGLLKSALETRKDWLYETAGIVFRLHGMSLDGELPGIDKSLHANINDAVELILSPFEGMHRAMNGTFYGALYMQAVVPFLCAQRACGVSQTLRKTVERVGKAMVARYHLSSCPERFKAGALENMHVGYIEQTHIPVWGSRDGDIVWQTFYEIRQKSEHLTVTTHSQVPPLVQRARSSRSPLSWLFMPFVAIILALCYRCRWSRSATLE